MPGRKRFYAKKSQDFTIIDDGGVVCHLRIKQGAIAIKGRNEQEYYQVYYEDFLEWARETGWAVTR